MQQHVYRSTNGLVHSRNIPLNPGELRVGGVRLYPTLDHGESTIRVHVTNEVDMFVAKLEARLALIRFGLLAATGLVSVITCVVLLFQFR